MSITLMSRVYEKELDSHLQRVLIVLCDHANDDGLAWPSIPLIAWKLGVSEKTARRGVIALESLGALTVDREKGKVNRYRVNLEALPDKPPFVPKREIGRGDVSERDRWIVWERDNFTCQHCGSRKDLTVDHITPRSAGGPAHPDNYQTLCRRCNARKGHRDPGHGDPPPAGDRPDTVAPSSGPPAAAQPRTPEANAGTPTGAEPSGNRQEEPPREPSGGAPKAPTRRPLPQDFAVTADMRDWARRKYGVTDAYLDDETEAFTLHWTSTGDRKADWPATWKVWIRRSLERRAAPGRTPRTATVSRPDEDTAEHWFGRYAEGAKT